MTGTGVNRPGKQKEMKQHVEQNTAKRSGQNRKTKKEIAVKASNVVENMSVGSRVLGLPGSLQTQPQAILTLTVSVMLLRALGCQSQRFRPTEFLHPFSFVSVCSSPFPSASFHPLLFMLFCSLVLSSFSFCLINLPPYSILVPSFTLFFFFFFFLYFPFLYPSLLSLIFLPLSPTLTEALPPSLLPPPSFLSPSLLPSHILPPSFSPCSTQMP